jgi:hypothetical protein
MTPRHFLLRAVRHGPLVPARLYWLDHEPGCPENKREGSRWPVYIQCADIAGVEVEPERVTDRMHRPDSHWGALQTITETEYRYRLARLRWAERGAPDDPTLRPTRKVDPARVPMPSFERENA